MESFDEFDISAFLSNVAKKFCPECGVAITPNRNGRPRVFCSDECRMKWNRRNPKPEHWSSARTIICPICEKPFLSAKETYRPRKYCSRACANRGRAIENGSKEDEREDH